MKDWVTVASAYIGLRDLLLPYEARFRDGLTVSLEEFADLETLWHIFFHNVYDVRPTDTCIVDAGANIGLFACWAARRAPKSRIYAIEPFPRTFHRLEANLSRNGLEHRVQCLNVALSARAGALNMYELPEYDSPSQQFRVLTEKESTTKSGILVAGQSLGQVLASLPSPINLIKMDIEGSEYEVLLSLAPAELKRVDRLNVEYHEPRPGENYSKTQLIDQLLRSGLSLTKETAGLQGYGLLYFERL